ncbi:bifunctional [glutamate--ammonia ligase]-adenylyl-L-tyrosine phosphorylase/[glutamate--ammonia-ligase] adenylyltransferase [Gammaproteobacteria bacterium AH-315-C21]|nr:bifunctional [glutamate--ammonia ligase]-adenylyl-L-tyrosine phosphorylase/[glutamate--ammonia-ligase] adenylyltransferase [Gammaproteobacteria bacterium AH-315-C21]
MALLSGSQLSVLGEMPVELRASVTASLESFHRAAKAAKVRLVTHPDLLKVLWRVWSYSEYVADSAAQNPSMLAELIGGGDLLTDYSSSEYEEKLHALCSALDNETELASVLRQFRRREMVRIAWRDLAQWSDIDTTMRELSALADSVIRVTNEWLYRSHCEKYGTPYGEQSNHPQELVVIAMGKLGAGELNFSSDIDLIFCYPEEGETKGAARSCSNEEFFVRLCQSFITALDKKTEDGFVFRVDVRLRPFGKSGPLAVSYDFLSDYYETHGREWERYAMVKARAVTGDDEAKQALQKIITPFVYRRYLDYGSVDELRTMKAAINAEVKRKGKQGDIKLGRGGIREIEFIGQTFQLMRGGWQAALRQRPILTILAYLGRLNYLPLQASKELIVAYRFLRKLENRIQAWRDEQTHTLPTDATGQLRIALSMGLDNWQEFLVELTLHQDRVSAHFDALIAAPKGDDDVDALAIDTWQAVLDDSEKDAEFDSLGFADGHHAFELLTSFTESSAYRKLTAQARKRVDQLMPSLLTETGEREQPEIVLRRVVNVVEAVSRRVTYLILLQENPAALTQFVTLCAASSWVTDQLIATPILMDQLLDVRVLYAPLDSKSLGEELNSVLMGIDDDLEQQMDVFRHFKMNQVLRVAAADVAGVYPLMEVSDHLTSIAETLLNKVIATVWADFIARYGRPSETRGGKTYYPGIAVVAYGKLGGIELSYGSDLDLVFLHDSGEEGCTEGEEVIDNSVFFARLVQRVMHIMGSHTPAGVLYEMDLRLRPSGASGLLVSPVDAFFEYQKADAWTWEHQALVRARAVAGHERVMQCFGKMRDDILTRQRNAKELLSDVSDMRNRMRKELIKNKKGEFDLKQGIGGIADIEFMVQYLVLRWAHSHQDLTQFTDNIRLLELLSDRGLLAKRDAVSLADIYREYRSTVHRQTLQGNAAIIKVSAYEQQREAVSKIWSKIFSK